MNATFYANLTDDPDGGFIVTFPDVSEAITGGETRREALEMASDALTVALLGRLQDGCALPKAETVSPSLVAVTVPAQFAAKIALIQAYDLAQRANTGINQSELARRLNVDHKEIRRRLDPNHKTKLPALEETLKALGKRLVIRVEDAV